jgi:hypothetical protein
MDPAPEHREPMQSEAINELATALAKAQGAISGAVKDSANPFFKSSYADLQSVWDACRQPLTANGLAVVQTTEAVAEAVHVVTTLVHASGQWMRGRLVMRPVKNDPQGIGSCLTYARRYALAAIVGVYQTDDDAEGAQGRNGKAKAATSRAPSRGPAPPGVRGGGVDDERRGRSAGARQ